MASLAALLMCVFPAEAHAVVRKASLVASSELHNKDVEEGRIERLDCV